MVDIRRHFSGEWSLKTEIPYEKVDANKVKFIVALKPHERRAFGYEVITHYGANVAR